MSAILPQLVPRDKLTRVNGINASLQSSTMLVSPVVSGALMTLSSIENIFFIDVFTAAAAISILFFFLKIPLHAKAGAKQTVGYFEDLKRGIRYIMNHSFIKMLFIYYAVLLVLVSPVAFLSPLQVARSYGPDVWRLTAVEVAFSVGMMGGGAIIAAWGGFKNRIRTMALASFMVGAGTFALGFTPLFAVYLAFIALTGLAVPLFNTPATVLLQEKVEEDYLGRVFGVLTMISTSMMPLGMLLFGPLADHIRIEWLMIATGALMAVQGFFLLGNRKLIKEGLPPEKAAGS